MEQPDEHIFVRVSALCALTLLADPSPATSSAEEREWYEDFLARLLPFVCAFLPAPAGVVSPLKSLCMDALVDQRCQRNEREDARDKGCLLYTSPSPRD